MTEDEYKLDLERESLTVRIGGYRFMNGFIEIHLSDEDMDRLRNSVASVMSHFLFVTFSKNNSEGKNDN